jgi:hypothetical protein
MSCSVRTSCSALTSCSVRMFWASWVSTSWVSTSWVSTLGVDVLGVDVFVVNVLGVDVLAVFLVIASLSPSLSRTPGARTALPDCRIEVRQRRNKNPFSRRERVRALPTTTPLPKKFAAVGKKAREAARRKAHPTNVRAASNRRRRLPTPGRGSALFRGALAFRRTAAALAGTLTSRLSSRPCFLGPGGAGVTRPFLPQF